MGRKRRQAESLCGEQNNSVPEESNDVQSKVEDKKESEDKGNHTDDSSAINLVQDTNETEVVPVVTLTAAEESGISSRPRRKCTQASYCSPRPVSPESERSPTPKRKKLKKPHVENTSVDIENVTAGLAEHSNISYKTLEDDSDDEKESSSFTSLALDKLKFDIQIDPNVVDRYTDSGFTAGGSTPESPETRRQRIDIISRQCRLHPANKKYNQGPVENPPLITPGKLVGFTPGGQRHEVDLNADRPTWFNSEYARMQWDYATRVNVTRMFHELETGNFLPDGLDPNIERRYFAEKEMASKQATEHFQAQASASSSQTNNHSTVSDLTSEDKEHLQLLESEKELIELNQYAVVRLPDFAEEIDRKLRKALDLTLTPLMIKKNPGILETLDSLASQCMHIQLVVSARALRDKIQGLFQVPENKEFREYFTEEVEKLKTKTKDMSPFDILMMTEEPADEDEISMSDTEPVSSVNEGEYLSESGDNWVPVDDGDVWVDYISNSSDAHEDASSVSEFMSSDDEDSVIEWSSSEDEDEYSTDDSRVPEAAFNVLVNAFGSLISGMRNYGCRLTVTVSYFEYI